MSNQGWAARLSVCGEWLVWVVMLGVFWVTFTLSGGIVFGFAPASVAAATLVRERFLGRNDRIWRDGARFWRQSLLSAQPAVLPLGLVSAALGVNYLWLSLAGPEAAALRILTLIAAVLALSASAWTAPLAAHYELRPWGTTILATRLILTRPASTVLLAFCAAAIVYGAVTIPVLCLPAIGGWFTASTLLCLRFFADNENRQSGRHDITPDYALPTEPLSVR